MKLILRYLIIVLSLIITDRFFPGVYFTGYRNVLLFALVLSVMNTFVRPVLFLLTIPMTVMSLGLFLLLINAIIILWAAEITPGIHIDNFWTGFWFSIVYSLISLILNLIFIKDVQVKIHIERHK